MRKLTRWAALASCAFAVTAGSVVALASLDSGPIEVNIPFEFVVHRATLPAGTYIIDRADPADPSTLVIRSADGENSREFLTEEATLPTPAQEPEVVFQIAGGKHYLWQVQDSASSSANQLSPAAMGLQAKAMTGEQRVVKAHHASAAHTGTPRKANTSNRKGSRP